MLSAGVPTAGCLVTRGKQRRRLQCRAAANASPVDYGKALAEALSERLTRLSDAPASLSAAAAELSASAASGPEAFFGALARGDAELRAFAARELDAVQAEVLAKTQRQEEESSGVAFSEPAPAGAQAGVSEKQLSSAVQELLDEIAKTKALPS